MAVSGSDGQHQLLHELKQLRRGWGLHSTDVADHLGPLLCAVCGIGDDMAAGQRRSRLIDVLEIALHGMPAEMETAARAALALHPEAQDRFLSVRMAWLAQHLDRNERTAARRADEALEFLAERMGTGFSENDDAENEFAPRGWYVEFQQTTVMLHRDPVRLHEVRRVRSTRDGLDELTVAWSIPAVPDGELRAEMVFGGDLVKDEENSTATYWTGRIKLPRPLMTGAEHTCELLVTTVPRKYLLPYFVISPYRRCDEFVLRTKFAPDRLPAEIWELNRVPFTLVHENQPVGSLLSVDGANEITNRFTNLQSGFSYGLRWHDRDSHPELE
jgi:hypothetical protein